MVAFTLMAGPEMCQGYRKPLELMKDENTPDSIANEIGAANHSGETLPERVAAPDISLPGPLNAIPLTVQSQDYIRAGLEGAANTARAYRSDLKQFTAFCHQRGMDQPDLLPASSGLLIEYVTHLARTKKIASIERNLAGIKKWHELAGHADPTDNKTFRMLLKGIKRKKGVRQKQAKAFTLDAFKKTVRLLDESDPTQLRDKVILLLGFTSALRRSELCALDLPQLESTQDCVLVHLTRSKTNQEGENELKAIFYSPEVMVCPIRTLHKWLAVLGRTDGPLLVRIRRHRTVTPDRLTDQSVNAIVKKYLGEQYSAHSLRASFVTVAKRNGAQNSEIMRQTGHRTETMIRRYTRFDQVQEHNAAMKLGL